MGLFATLMAVVMGTRWTNVRCILSVWVCLLVYLKMKILIEVSLKGSMMLIRFTVNHIDTSNGRWYVLCLWLVDHSDHPDCSSLMSSTSPHLVMWSWLTGLLRSTNPPSINISGQYPQNRHWRPASGQQAPSAAMAKASACNHWRHQQSPCLQDHRL